MKHFTFFCTYCFLRAEVGEPAPPHEAGPGDEVVMDDLIKNVSHFEPPSKVFTTTQYPKFTIEYHNGTLHYTQPLAVLIHTLLLISIANPITFIFTFCKESVL